MSRPITTGTGIRLSAYIPLIIWKRLEGRLQELGGVSVSTFVQEAITRYLDDLELESMYQESTMERRKQRNEA